MPQIRLSLKTTSKREGDKIAGIIDERLEKAFADIRMHRLTQSEAQLLINQAIEFGGITNNEPTLRIVAQEYECTKGQSWSAKGKQEYWKSIATMEAIIGNRVVRLIDRATVIGFRDNLHATGIKPRTVNKYIQRLSSVMNYATTTGIITSNPCAASVKFELAKSETTENRYLPYTDSDVQWILQEMLIKPGNYGQYDRWCPYMYWLPLIAAYSGARLGDLADLEKSNFVKKGDIDCVIIGNRKTGAPARTIPIHSRLIWLGILEYVEALKEGQKLFHIQKHRREGEYNWKWYMVNLRKHIQEPRKVFHSWRATIASRLNDAGVNSVHRADILGHERVSDCETDRTYTSITQIQTLRIAIEKLDYPGIDWNSVKIPC